MDNLNMQPAPVLLKIPLKNQHNSRSMVERERNLIHIPKLTNPSPTFLALSNPPHNTNYKPKLIDLRPILKQRKVDQAKVIEIVSPLRKREPKLLRLPVVETKTPFLISPPVKKAEPVVKPLSPTMPTLVDLRPQFSENGLKLLTKTPNSYNRENISLSSPNISQKAMTGKENVSSPRPSQHVPQKRNRRSTRRNSNPNQEISMLVEQANEKKRHREDQLFDIINELLTQKRAKRRNKKQLRLFDVIDNIPITSDSDSELDSNARRKYTIKNSEHIDCQTHNTLKKYGLTLPIDFHTRPEQEKATVISHTDPLHASIDKAPRSSGHGIFQTKPQNHNENEDHFSWVNLVREFRHECKGTQTEKKNTRDHLHTKEVQTEIKEMLEIPQSQTFFLDPSSAVSKEKTKEFCERVRKEVIEKLEYQEKLEDKVTQTISHACVQTDVLEENKEQDVSALNHHHHHHQVDEVDKSVSLGTILPPSIYSEIKIEGSSEQFIHVTDVNTLQHDHEESTDKRSPHSLSKDKYVNEKIEGSSHIDISKQKVKKKKKSKKSDSSSSSSTSNSSSSDSSRKDKDERKKKEKKKAKKKKKDLCDEQKQKTGGTKLITKEALHSPGKTILYENMNDFSYGLKALEDLQEHIEAELKQSRLLFNTISIIQDGFNEESTADPTKAESETVEEPLSPLEISLGRDERPHGNVLEAEISKDTMENLNAPESKDYKLNSINRSEDSINTNDIFNQNQERSPSFDKHNFLLSQTHEKDLQMNSNEYRSYDFQDHKENEMENQDDALKKEEIRKKLNLDYRPTEQEIKGKFLEEDRSRLVAWMKEKQMIQRNEYLQNLTEKRAAEYRPFTSNAAYTRRQIDQNTTIQADLRRAMLDENNKQRRVEAERMAYEAMDLKMSLEKSTATKRSNNRYKKATKGIPIRDTRSSKLRKNALVREVMKYKAVLRNQTSKLKSTNKNRKKEKVNNSPVSFGETLLDQSFDIRSVGEHGMDNVHPDQFVTRGSYMKYRKKAAQRFEEHFSTDDHRITSYDRQAFNGVRYRNTLMSRQIKTDVSNTMSRLGTLHENSLVAQSPHDVLTESLQQVAEKNRPSSHVDNDQLKNILKSYGLQMDSDLFERKSETSLLLNEADLALLDDDTSSQMRTNETVDWDEVEKILNE